MEKKETYFAAKLVDAVLPMGENGSVTRSIKSPHFKTREEAVKWIDTQLRFVTSCGHALIHSKEYDNVGLIQKDLIEYFYEW